MSGKRTTSGDSKKIRGFDPDGWKTIRNEEIDCSDIPATDEAFWHDAELVLPGQKVALGVRFDKDIVDWFKSQGPGYQTRMNTVLRYYMDSQRKKSNPSSKQKTRRSRKS